MSVNIPRLKTPERQSTLQNVWSTAASHKVAYDMILNNGIPLIQTDSKLKRKKWRSMNFVLFLISEPFKFSIIYYFDFCTSSVIES
jgi:hypothetical protein